MKLDIKLTDKLEHSCFDGLLVSIAEWKKKDYRLAHAEAWDFIVNCNLKENHPETAFGMLDKPCTLKHDLLKSYSGISYNYYDFDHNIEKFLIMLKKELSQQRLIIILLDYCWCPWNKDVSKITHMSGHASLVIGFDQTGFICLDYDPRCDKCTLPYEFINKIDGYCTINIEEPIVGNNYHDILNRSIQVIENHDIFNNIREFGRFVRESFNPVKDLEYVDNNSFIPNMWQISLTAEGRNLYSSTLRALSEKYNIKSLQTIAERLESTKPMWSVIKILLTKIYLTKSLRLSKILADKICEIADYEEDIYNCLVMINKDSDSQI